MDVTKAPHTIRALNPAAEDALITFRLAHPDVPARQFARRAHHFNSVHIPASLRDLSNDGIAGKGDIKRRQLLEVEIIRFATSLKKTKKAAEAQARQEESYRSRCEELERQCEQERQALQAAKDALVRNKKQRESYEKCDELARRIVERKNGRVELDELIASTSAAIATQQARHDAYTIESTARHLAFTSVRAALDAVMAIQRVEPERSKEDLEGLEGEVAAAAKAIAGTEGKDGDGKIGVSAGETGLDPKAVSFVPTITVLPSSTASITTTAMAATSAARHHSSASRAVTPTPSSSSTAAQSSTNTNTPTRKANIPGLPSRPQVTANGGELRSQPANLATRASPAPRASVPGLPARPDTSSAGSGSSAIRPASSRTVSSAGNGLAPPPSRGSVPIPNPSPTTASFIANLPPNSSRIVELSGAADDAGSTTSELEDGEVVGSKRGREASVPQRETRSKRARTAEADGK